MIKNFVKINRDISTWVLVQVKKLLGEIDNSENIFIEEINSIDLLSSRVLEIGGSQRPLFNKSDILFYVGLDVDSKFDWAKYYHSYFNQSCTEPINNKFDFIFSKYLLEHVNDNEKSFQNIINSLKSSGKSIHIFPLGFHPYSLLTRVVGNSLQRKLIRLLRPHSQTVGGYPVYFNLCNSVFLERFFRKQTDVVYKIKYFYGAEDYFAFFFPFFLLTMVFNRVCYLLNLKIFASNAVLTIIKK